MSARPTGTAWLVLPTYNEAENIRAIVDAAGAVLAEASPEGFRVLIVDDSSPDGTGELADQLAAEKQWVHVLHRAEKSGIGPAYLAGFAHALQAGAGCLMEMDSDFSHDPADLARLLEAVREGADLALGSRYVPGGGVTDWSLLRRFISEGGSTYARVVLGLHVRDLTGGFKCFRREVLEAIDFASVRSHGYAFQVELTYRAVRAGFRVVEVPIVFRDRLEGHSKMSWRITVEAMWLVPALRFSRTLGIRHPAAQPPVVDDLPPVADDLPPVVDDQPPVVDDQPAAPSAQPATEPHHAGAGVELESHGGDHAAGSAARLP